MAVFAETNLLVPSWEDFGGAPVASHAVGADGGSYRAVAIQAVMNAHAQHPSAAYGYLRTGQHQKVYLFPSLEDASAWYTRLAQSAYDYAAVFADTSLDMPVWEDFRGGSSASVGNVLPLLLGLPLGAAGGYFYRRWQETHPGKIVPWIGAETDVGAYPWYSIQDYGQPAFARRGPWIDIIGADPDVERRRAWPQTRRLIELAKGEVVSADRHHGASAYVWSLGLDGLVSIIPAPSHDDGLAVLREIAYQSQPAALALFDRTSHHWPNPVSWQKGTGDEYAGAIAQYLTQHSPGQAAVGALPWQNIVGGGPWQNIVGADVTITEAIATLRQQARSTVEEVAPRSRGRVVGIVLRGLDRFDPRAWEVKSFANQDLAEDWYERVTGDPRTFTYAAYFDKDGPTQLAEAVGGAYHSSQVSGRGYGYAA